MPKQMSKIRMTCAKSDAESVIRTLYKNKVLHIQTHEKKGKKDLDIGEPFLHSSSISELLIKTRSLMQVLNINPHKHKHKHADSTHTHHRQSIIRDVDELYESHFHSAATKRDVLELDSVHGQVQNILKRKAECAEMEKYTKKTLELVSWYEPFYIELESYHEASRQDSRLRVIAGTASQEAMPSIYKELSQFHEQFEILSEPSKNETKLLIIADREIGQAVEDILKRKNFKPQPLPLVEGMAGMPELESMALKHQLRRIAREQKALEHRLAELKNKLAGFLIEFEDVLSQESEQAQAPLQFMASRHTITITGYVPKDREKATREAVKKAARGNIVIAEEKISDENEVPIALENRKVAKPFEFLLKLYSLPAYAEFDPSVLLLITFPLFFGMMLGDIGYGIVSLALFMAIRKKMGQLKPLAGILIVSSISTIAFGAVYGEFFGLEEIMHQEIPYLIHRSHDLNTMMMLAVVVGALHLMASFIIGFFNELHHKGFEKAFAGKFGWVFLEIGAGMLIASMFQAEIIARTGYYIPAEAAYAVIAASIIMIGYGEGVRGVVELPGVFSNMLSYMRLMAVGLASVSLAVVVNDLAGGLFQAGILGAIGGILVLVAGHAINLVLGLLGPFLHALRLHYVESFTKFFEGGGREYRPFGSA